MIQIFEINHLFPTRSELTDIKFIECVKIAKIALVSERPMKMSRAMVEFIWKEQRPLSDRELDEIFSGGQKILLNAIREAGILKCVSKESIIGIKHNWSLSPRNFGVKIIMDDFKGISYLKNSIIPMKSY